MLEIPLLENKKGVRFYGFLVLWFLVLWLYGFGVMVLWFYGFMVLWFDGFMVLWEATAIDCRGAALRQRYRISA